MTLDTLNLLCRMQQDCYKATQVVKDMVKLLNHNPLSDALMDVIIELGSTLFLQCLKVILEKPSTAGELTLDDLKRLESDYDITKGQVNDIIRRLDYVSSINYFDMRAVDGVFVIHQSEFLGMGCTSIDFRSGEKRGIENKLLPVSHFTEYIGSN